jgi:hypothetical protein
MTMTGSPVAQAVAQAVFHLALSRMMTTVPLRRLLRPALLALLLRVRHLLLRLVPLLQHDRLEERSRLLQPSWTKPMVARRLLMRPTRFQVPRFPSGNNRQRTCLLPRLKLPSGNKLP